ncbi:MAG: FHA domain-containing protein [Aphanocapsa sp. GSE-SYN-MK-11-07L]|jgi:pSer/pThr/pTyr-binding forkhead associated (FHA) protein|nr:FHA domain-containing protein [Aphanocapsa sp. GSE-SYN-MK-11-07L]
MTEKICERHVLVVDDENGRRSIALDAATYSLGRDQTNAIMLESKSVSRQHALLLRLPVPETAGYRYRLVDGNSEGRPSVNGVMVNGKRCSSHNLANGDVIVFGRFVKASYMIVSMGQAEFIKYLDMINFQSIKSELTNAKETIVGVDFDPAELEQKVVQAEAQSQPQPDSQPKLANPKVWLIGVAGIMVGLIFGGIVFLTTGQLTPQPPEQPANPPTAPR